MKSDSKTSQLSLFSEPAREQDVRKRSLPQVVPAEYNNIPDVRDGLTREQRVILYTLYEAEKERPGKAVPTLMLYGRVVERMPMSKEHFKALLANLVGRGTPLL